MYLSIGSYEVTFTFDSDNIPDNAIAPSYIVQITALPDMSAQEQGINLKTKTGSFRVSGSKSYTVQSNGKNYQYQFEDSGENLIAIPLKDGLNAILISGEAVCLGVIKKEILLNDIFIYPNPTNNFVSIFSNYLLGEYQIHIFDIQGRLVYQKKSNNAVNMVELDISKIQKGMYLGRITSKNMNKVEFKLIKN